MRKLASIRRILNILPIENADAIELAQVDGWQVVVKKGEYKVDDLAVYLEVDSWVPHEFAPFLSKGKEPREFNDIKGERLRTMKLRGALSQGLLLPVFKVPNQPHIVCIKDIEGISLPFVEGDDVTEVLGIQKWEAPIPAQLAGQVKGNFPSEIPKTDQERVQNIKLSDFLSEEYEVTEKLHGSSCTFYLSKEGEFHVCSRNLSLKPDPNNAYWKAAYKLDVEHKMRQHNMLGFAIQGELCGEGINGNNYRCELDFFMFDIYQVGYGYLNPEQRSAWNTLLRIPHVPVLHTRFLLPETIKEILAMAERPSYFSDPKHYVEAEGLVFKSHGYPRSFKAVSNKWLLKHE